MRPALPRFRDPKRRIGAWLWTLRGRRRLRSGGVGGAIEAFEQALVRRPERFRTLVDLAIAHLIARDVTAAQVALVRAQRAHPVLFAERAGRLLGRWGFEMPRTQLAPRPRPVAQAATAHRERSIMPQAHPFGDCVDLDEYARFSAMPPITRAEIESLDWDRVIGDLMEE